MPKLSVWMVRSSLLWMGLGFLFGSLLLHHKGIPIYAWTWRLLPPHIEIMIFGWVVQLAMGMAFWILPRYPENVRADKYGNTRVGWGAWALVNAGIAVSAWGGWDASADLQLVGRLLLLGGAGLFVAIAWGRVRPFGVFTPGEAGYRES